MRMWSDVWPDLPPESPEEQSISAGFPRWILGLRICMRLQHSLIRSAPYFPLEKARRFEDQEHTSQWESAWQSEHVWRYVFLAGSQAMNDKNSAVMCDVITGIFDLKLRWNEPLGGIPNGDHWYWVGEHPNTHLLIHAQEFSAMKFMNTSTARWFQAVLKGSRYVTILHPPGLVNEQVLHGTWNIHIYIYINFINYNFKVVVLVLNWMIPNLSPNKASMAKVEGFSLYWSNKMSLPQISRTQFVHFLLFGLKKLQRCFRLICLATRKTFPWNHGTAVHLLEVPKGIGCLAWVLHVWLFIKSLFVENLSQDSLRSPNHASFG